MKLPEKLKLNGRGPLITFVLAVVTVSTTVIVMGFWIIDSNAGLHTEISLVKKDIEHLAVAVNGAVDDRFRGRDWRTEEKWINERFDSIDEQLRKLDLELREHRGRNHGGR